MNSPVGDGTTSVAAVTPKKPSGVRPSLRSPRKPTRVKAVGLHFNAVNSGSPSSSPTPLSPLPPSTLPSESSQSSPSTLPQRDEVRDPQSTAGGRSVAFSSEVDVLQPLSAPAATPPTSTTSSAVFGPASLNYEAAARIRAKLRRTPVPPLDHLTRSLNDLDLGPFSPLTPVFPPEPWEATPKVAFDCSPCHNEGVTSSPKKQQQSEAFPSTVAHQPSPTKHHRKAKKKIKALASQLTRVLACLLLLPCLHALYRGAFPSILRMDHTKRRRHMLVCCDCDGDCTSEDPAELLRYLHASACTRHDPELLHEHYFEGYCDGCHCTRPVMLSEKGPSGNSREVEAWRAGFGDWAADLYGTEPEDQFSDDEDWHTEETEFSEFEFSVFGSFTRD